MTQQDVAAAVAEIIRNHIQIGGTDWSRNAGDGDINAEEVARLILSALQQRSGAVERASLVQAVIRATEDGDHHPHISQWAAEQAVTTVLRAILGGQSCPPQPHPQGKPS